MKTTMPVLDERARPSQPPTSETIAQVARPDQHALPPHTVPPDDHDLAARVNAPTPTDAAVEYLLACRQDDPSAAARAEAKLADLTEAELGRGLPDDHAKVAFWVDLYNGAVLLQEDIRLESWRQRLAFLRRTVVTVAGRPLTLDAMEHGILRRSRWKLGLGFVANPFPSAFERQQRVEHLDPRIHFALNCAAASCPPIAAYRVERIDEQLDLATRSYLDANVEVERDRIRVPQIFLWYPGDFGGPSGIRSFLRKHGIDGAGRKLGFTDYDWTPAQGQWTQDGKTEDP